MPNHYKRRLQDEQVVNYNGWSIYIVSSEWIAYAKKQAVNYITHIYPCGCFQSKYFPDQHMISGYYPTPYRIILDKCLKISEDCNELHEM